MEGKAEIRLISIEHKIEDYFQQLSTETTEILILSTFIMSFFHGSRLLQLHYFATKNKTMNFQQHAIDAITRQGVVSSPFFLYKLGITVPEDVKRLRVDPSVAALPANAFAGRRQLKEVVLPEGLEEIGRRAFNSCRSLKRINFPSTLTAIGPFAFGHCTSLREVDLSKVTTIGTSAFGGCRALERINIPSTVTTVIGAAAFC
mmetsp:Transcript_1502/g.2932  ORF Transcript_1502/g.2932 Transcript_1502/m.2932 type:complete len:203 (+) Transcript_1502:122-730(+)